MQLLERCPSLGAVLSIPGSGRVGAVLGLGAAQPALDASGSALGGRPEHSPEASRPFSVRGRRETVYTEGGRSRLAPLPGRPSDSVLLGGRPPPSRDGNGLSGAGVRELQREEREPRGRAAAHLSREPVPRGRRAGPCPRVRPVSTHPPSPARPPARCALPSNLCLQRPWVLLQGTAGRWRRPRF